jgi:hypothetical protein
MKKLMLILLSGLSLNAVSQTTQKDSVRTDSISNIKFNYKQLIIPSVLIGYGLVGLESDQLKSFNLELRDEVTEDIDEKLTVDDFMQWAPAVSVYALNAAGIKGKNNLKDRSVVIATSYVLMTATVLSLKKITHVERPDGTGNDSFPSGHTANAFAGAEFLLQEYKHRSIWYGVAGYAVATGTAAFRIYNNRHWLTDVAAGAGIGILSTKAGYWLQPWISGMLSGKENKKVSIVAPFYNGNQAGLCMLYTF